MDEANLNRQDAIERLRAYVPPPTNYAEVPLSRRAAVLILLYADRRGDLKVVLTMRAKTLSSCMFVAWLTDRQTLVSEGRLIAWSC